MSKESPFFLSKVECPICKTINEFETVRVGAYVENGRDTDFCPVDIQWRYPRYQGYNPLVFFTATCSNCYYTREFSTSFKDWKNDANYKMYRLKTVKEKHLDQLATADSIIRSLGEAVDTVRHPNESAIIKLHLAVFDELLAERISNLDLGRFYLRIGWVFRDLEKGENPNVKSLQGQMRDIDNKFTVFKAALQSGRDELAAFSKYLSGQFDADKLPAEVKAQVFAYRDKFGEQMSALEQTMGKIDAGVGGMGQLINEYKTVTLGSGGSAESPAFGRHSSFSDYLMNLKQRWDSTVVNEHEALEKAVYYYREAFVGDRDISPGNQQIQASYLIAELSRRIGDYDGARQFFNSTIKHGQEFIYQNRTDPSRTALARKILELAIEQGKANIEASKTA